MFMQRQLASGSLDHTVYFRNKPHEILQFERTLVNSPVIIQTRDFEGHHGDCGSVLRVLHGYKSAVKDEKSMAQTGQAV